MINIASLLAYYSEHPDFKVKVVKETDINIEYLKSVKPRKNVLAELYPKTGRFYLHKDGDWININKLPDIQTDSAIIAWIEKDSKILRND